jgi:hypothetical protein
MQAGAARAVVREHQAALGVAVKPCSLTVAGSFVLAAPLNAASECSYPWLNEPLSRFEARSLWRPTS